ncbi:bifunctional glucose-1-phosphatase/inositol phosphatase [Gilliamella sp. B2776]|uniref:bifunctional glucose-1-phosphatase/inositol phosphatase n=1 Tax=unclassified Gilliamella TaxID=2685620 RepID=UPI00226A2315|nr:MULTISPECIES: bifunctional glucose-1-phosphatase/inositol phosphatase [unclassified Gilliamella]MCX8649803.1 bifunctional glucose-1-phosphatase/inositol phosphatase [Gilliamella sp. B2779]MCX8653686.1 bifunctional glucose-1-phosphatase/inositol phosphatase [Gilliamella sp. B2737]MCX8656123.1 bifunctional glucose-1-phosphatase/inositol phosphatase [Gilliamella sp. B2894]MCX8691576.1 bifunctional glucose-1-phosphatase/inositol phosphatase [Gilliamella sp. B2776]MCX8693372.1 bifunctional gluco
MRKLKIILALSFVLSFSVQAIETLDKYTLEQVIVFSRHGLRAPLSSPTSTLGKITPNQWPQWDTPASYLTARGGVLESYFGHYFSEWFIDNKLLTGNTCPSEHEVYIYTNSLQRTIATGQYFTVGAFPGCIIPIMHKEKLGTMDPVFFPVIRDDNPKFKKMAIISINQTANEKGIEGLNQKLNQTYQDLSNILNYTQSTNCLTDKQCDFTNLPTQFIIEKGKEPGITGPLRIGTSIADAFILQYYEGAPLQDIAWGKIKSNQKFEQLVSIKEYYNSVLFGAPIIAKQVAANLINYINQAFSENNHTKFTLLVGHDSNVASLLSALKIKSYKLPDQFEKTPIGGKIVFQKWRDNYSGKTLMKIEYFYQSTDQIRNLTQLNRNNPPHKVTLAMENCPIDTMGFCSFSIFKKFISNIN